MSSAYSCSFPSSADQHSISALNFSPRDLKDKREVKGWSHWITLESYLSRGVASTKELYSRMIPLTEAQSAKLIEQIELIDQNLMIEQCLPSKNPVFLNLSRSGWVLEQWMGVRANSNLAASWQVYFFVPQLFPMLHQHLIWYLLRKLQQWSELMWMNGLLLLLTMD